LLFHIIQLPSYVCFDQLKLVHTNNNDLPHSNQQLIPLPLIQLRQIFLKFSSLLLSFIYCIYLRDHWRHILIITEETSSIVPLKNSIFQVNRLNHSLYDLVWQQSVSIVLPFLFYLSSQCRYYPSSQEKSFQCSPCLNQAYRFLKLSNDHYSFFHTSFPFENKQLHSLRLLQLLFYSILKLTQHYYFTLKNNLSSIKQMGFYCLYFEL